MNSQLGGGAREIPVISPQDFFDKAPLELSGRFGIQNTPLHHLPAEAIETLLEP
jgi:hypothetical protein